MLICEDAWYPAAARDAAAAGAEVLAVINASPFHAGQELPSASKPCGSAWRQTGLPLLYAHLVGGQDEVVFEGHSLLWGPMGVWPGARLDLKKISVTVRLQQAQGAIELIADMAPRAQR